MTETQEREAFMGFCSAWLRERSRAMVDLEPTAIGEVIGKAMADVRRLTVEVAAAKARRVEAASEEGRLDTSLRNSRAELTRLLAKGDLIDFTELERTDAYRRRAKTMPDSQLVGPT